jgi:hypothetical protein
MCEDKLQPFPILHDKFGFKILQNPRCLSARHRIVIYILPKTRPFDLPITVLRSPKMYHSIRDLRFYSSARNNSSGHSAFFPHGPNNNFLALEPFFPSLNTWAQNDVMLNNYSKTYCH